MRSENLIRPRAKLKRNDMVVIDNLPAHKVLAYARRSKRAAPHSAICPQYSPDLNPIEMPFSKLKACNYFRHAGYA